jgi:hypothetical protein
MSMRLIGAFLFFAFAAANIGIAMRNTPKGALGWETAALIAFAAGNIVLGIYWLVRKRPAPNSEK